MALGASGVSSGGASERVERGRYLANGITRCFWCHSALSDGDPATPLPETLGAGDILDPKAPVTAPNITSDPETGIGRWRDDEIVRAIREGIGRDGGRLRGEHPDTYYSVMTDEDALAIASYLRSLPPIHRVLPRSAPQLHRGEPTQPPVQPAKAEDLGSPVARGAYLVQLGECRGCHTTTTREGRPYREMAFGGGRRFRLENGTGNEIWPDPSFVSEAAREEAGEANLVASANITRDPSGIAFYTEDIFAATIRTGRVGGVRRLSAAMPWVFFRTLSDEDLAAIFAYLQTVPPVRHRISNTDPPTLCPVCGRRHGLGELNVAPATGQGG